MYSKHLFHSHQTRKKAIKCLQQELRIRDKVGADGALSLHKRCQPLPQTNREKGKLNYLPGI